MFTFQLKSEKNKVEYETASDSFYCSVYLILAMLDHFLGDTTGLDLPPSTEFYIVIGSVRKTCLFFKLQLKKNGKLFFLIDNRV